MLRILDSTLREGEQTPGVCFDVHIKIAIADLLDQLGVGIIEAGHPVVTAEIRHAVAEISRRRRFTSPSSETPTCDGISHKSRAVVGAHARSLTKDVDIALDCHVDFLGIFYCVSDQRLNHHSRKLNQAVDQIAGTISYARERKEDLLIRYTPEDTVRSPWKNVITVAAEAVKAGADIISVADTTGYMIPGTSRSMYDYVKRLIDELADRDLFPEIGVHCHNDRGLALANALDGYRAGASIIDTAVLNLGERTGIVDLATLLSVLSTDFNKENTWNLQCLPSLYQLVSRYAGVPVPINFPVVGGNAFTHCAGVHTHATIKNPLHYQSLQPEFFGRRSQISLDHMSGLSAVMYSLEHIGEGDVDRETALNVLKKVKQVGRMGRTVDYQELKYIVKYVNEHKTQAEIEQVLPKVP